MCDVVVKLYVSKLYKYKWSVTLRKLINWKSNKSAGSPKYLPERSRRSGCDNKFLPERRSGKKIFTGTAFRHHYTTGVRVRVTLGIGLGLGFRSGQSQCVPPLRFVNYHTLVKSGTRRSRSVPPFRKLYQSVVWSDCVVRQSTDTLNTSGWVT